MNILAIQSHVAYGHVGLGAGLLPLWRLGHEVWPVATVAYSNHPAYGSFEGRVAEDAELAALITGVAARGALAACDAMLSGYLGSGGQGAVVLDAVAHVRSSSVSALYCCDPVMAHEGQGFFVAREIAEFMRAEAVPAADIVTPNQVELEYLSGRRIEGLEDALAACQAVRAAGPGLVVVTSLEPGDHAPGALDTLAVSGRGAWRVRTPRLDGELYGAGDLFAALFLGNYLVHHEVADALSRAVSGTYGVLAASVAGGGRELAIVDAQEEIVALTRRFTAERVG